MSWRFILEERDPHVLASRLCLHGDLLRPWLEELPGVRYDPVCFQLTKKTHVLTFF
jgi:hypothetical protein